MLYYNLYLNVLSSPGAAGRSPRGGPSDMNSSASTTNITASNSKTSSNASTSANSDAADSNE